MNRLAVFALVGLFCAFQLAPFPQAAASALDPENLFDSSCKQIPSASFSFCVHKPKTNPSDDFVYYLHGGENSEQTWSEKWFYTSQLRQEWLRLKVKIPTVIAISFGPSWLLAKQNSSRASGLFELLTTSLIPAIEKELGEIKGRRIVFGDSMGGFNTLQLALHSKLFDKAASICTPMASVSPFSDPAMIDSHIKQSSAWHYYRDIGDPAVVTRAVSNIIKLTQTFYPKEADWMEADPVVLAEKVVPQDLPALYVTVGFYDRFAAYEGNQLFVDKLTERGIPVEWRPQWGGHCAVDISSLAKFLTD